MINKHTCKYWKKKCVIGYACCPDDWDETECEEYSKMKKKKKKNVTITTNSGQAVIVTHKINQACKPKPKSIKKKKI